MITTSAEYTDLRTRHDAGEEIPVAEKIAAARFLITVSSPRRAAKVRAEGAAREGLEWVALTGVDVPAFPGMGRAVADRIRAWFEKEFPV